MRKPNREIGSWIVLEEDAGFSMPRWTIQYNATQFRTYQPDDERRCCDGVKGGLSNPLVAVGKHVLQSVPPQRLFLGHESGLPC